MSRNHFLGRDRLHDCIDSKEIGLTKATNLSNQNKMKHTKENIKLRSQYR